MYSVRVSAGTIAGIVVALMAVGALAISIISLVLQRKDVGHQEERWEQEEQRWQEQEERWKKEEERRKSERLPSLEVLGDSRLVTLVDSIQTYRLRSYRVVNTGLVPVEIRILRMVMKNGQTFPLPAVTDALKARLWENEKPVNGFTPFTLTPGNSVRFATMKEGMDSTVRKAGFSNFVQFEVAVEDALGNRFAVEESVLLSGPDPDP